MADRTSDRNATEFLNLRLPLYAYAAPLWQGRTVLEVGCGDGGSAGFLANQGAARVVAVDVDEARVGRASARHAQPAVEFRALASLHNVASVGGPFDVVLVPEGQAVLADSRAVAALRARHDGQAQRDAPALAAVAVVAVVAAQVQVQARLVRPLRV